MKVTVTKYLNVRVGEPSINAPNYQYLVPGCVIEVDGKLYEGEPFHGNTLWYKDKAGNYYWSGGIHPNPELLSLITDSDFWFKKLRINDIWETYAEQGDQSTVLILDTGINDELDTFSGALYETPKNFVPSSTTTKSVDSQNHGTHCAGIIASRPLKYRIGIAPYSKLMVAKINERGSLKDASTMNDALEEYLKPKYDGLIDIISISQSLLLSDVDLERLINEHLAKGRIVITAIGNDSFQENLNIEQYPGFYKSTIAVGACERDHSLSNYTCYPSAVDIFCYGTDIKSYTKENYPLPLTGTSQATAMVSGICALVVSYLKKRGETISNTELKKLLQRTAIPLTNNNDYKLIQPKMIFEQLILAV